MDSVPSTKPTSTFPVPASISRLPSATAGVAAAATETMESLRVLNSVYAGLAHSDETVEGFDFLSMLDDRSLGPVPATTTTTSTTIAPTSAAAALVTGVPAAVAAAAAAAAAASVTTSQTTSTTITKPPTTKSHRQSTVSKPPSPQESEDAFISSSRKRNRSFFFWSNDLHQLFLASIFELGLSHATPKNLHDIMLLKDDRIRESLQAHELRAADDATHWSTEFFTPNQIKPHLQRYKNNTKLMRKSVFASTTASLHRMRAAGNTAPDAKRPKLTSEVLHHYPFGDFTFANRQVHHGDDSRSSGEEEEEEHSRAASPVDEASVPSPSYSRSRTRTSSSSAAAAMEPSPFTRRRPKPTSSSSSGGIAVSSAAAAASSPAPLPNIRRMDPLESAPIMQFEAQMKMRENIESQFSRQIAQFPGAPFTTSTSSPPDRNKQRSMSVSEELFPVIDPNNDDSLFDWLLEPFDPMPPSTQPGGFSS